jgi:hypothetical protein
VYTATADWDAQMLRDILISRGIDAIVEDRFELYERSADQVLILNDADEARALEIAREFRASSTGQQKDAATGWGWRCPECREDVEPQFETCWNCGTEKPGS